MWFDPKTRIGPGIVQVEEENKMMMVMGSESNGTATDVGHGLDDAEKLTTPDVWRDLRSKYRVKMDGKARRSRRRKAPGMDLVDDIDLDGVVDFAQALQEGAGAHEEITRLENKLVGKDAGIKGYRGPLFGLKSRPGMVHCPCALSEDVQMDLARLALFRYCKAPHTTNVDAHMHRPENKRPKLTWASLGYHFNWTKRRYCESDKSPFPEELAHITRHFALSVDPDSHFKAEAAIVNFYKNSGNMGCHVDDSEDDEEHPVVSITTGLPAVFLVGTLDKSDAPIPILLRPGDVMMLAGPSRLCYHGIASILPCAVPLPSKVAALGPFEWTMTERLISDKEPEPELMDEKSVMETKEFLATHRINLNCRQVCITGKSMLIADGG